MGGNLNMAYAKGTVTAIFVKEKPEADQYGNTHRAAIKVDDGEWIGLGDMKGPKLTVKSGPKEYRELTKGSIVEFMYREKEGNNGNVFRDGKRSEVKVLEWAAAEPSTATAARPATTAQASPSTAPVARSTGSSGPDWNKKDAGIEAGHAVNGAVAIVAALIGNNTFTTNEAAPIEHAIKSWARTIHAATRELQGEVLRGEVQKSYESAAPVVKQEATKPTATTKPKPTPKPEPAVTAESWEEPGDDDTPF
jgi:hypothetical protein